MYYSEAKEQIEALSSKYSINMSDEDFNVWYNGESYAVYVSYDHEYGLNVGGNDTFSKLPFSNKLYMILAELAVTPLDKRVEEKKHYVKIYNDVTGYLNINPFNGKMSVHDVSEGYGCKTKFTDKEIEQLKQRDDIPLDWNKVTLKEAK